MNTWTGTGRLIRRFASGAGECVYGDGTPFGRDSLSPGRGRERGMEQAVFDVCEYHRRTWRGRITFVFHQRRGDVWFLKGPAQAGRRSDWRTSARSWGRVLGLSWRLVQTWRVSALRDEVAGARVI